MVEREETTRGRRVACRELVCSTGSSYRLAIRLRAAVLAIQSFTASRRRRSLSLPVFPGEENSNFSAIPLRRLRLPGHAGTCRVNATRRVWEIRFLRVARSSLSIYLLLDTTTTTRVAGVESDFGRSRYCALSARTLSDLRLARSRALGICNALPIVRKRLRPIGCNILEKPLKRTCHAIPAVRYIRFRKQKY